MPGQVRTPHTATLHHSFSELCGFNAKHNNSPGPSCRGVLAGLPHTTGLGFQTGHPDRRVLEGIDSIYTRTFHEVCIEGIRVSKVGPGRKQGW